MNNISENSINFIKNNYKQLGAKKISDILDINYNLIIKIARKNNLYFTGVDLVGKYFGKWKVIKKLEKNEIIKNKAGYHWLCQCECGFIQQIQTYQLTSKETNGCKKCIIRESNSTSKETVCGTLFSSYRISAKYRKLEFNITLDYAKEIFLKQQGKCNLSGIELIMIMFKKSKYNTASLDRIDNSKGYIEENIQWIHKHINTSKWKYSNEYLIQMYTKVAEWVIDNKKYKLDSKFDFKYLNRFYHDTKRGAKQRKIYFNLTKNNFIDLINKQNCQCALSGLSLNWNKDSSIRNMSLDRIDSQRPYVMDNIQLVHKDINWMKMQYSQPLFLHYCECVRNNNASRILA